ncbi:glycosyltransferase family 39 protein [Patescibacteria group bacterium]|nr:glycosyltransferase family 39 protein [Patescibacteria group bacterium]
MTLESLLQKIALVFSFLLCIALTFSIFGIFTAENFKYVGYALIVIVLVFCVKNFFLNKAKIWFSAKDIIAILIILLFCFLAFYFHHDITRGRDEMVHLVSAIQLTKYHSLEFTDQFAGLYSGFQIIDQNHFTPQFLPNYITALGSGYIAFGMTGLYLINGMLLFFGLIAIYYIAKSFKNSVAGLIAVSWFGTFYVAFWFSKRLNSEMLFFALFWITLWYFFNFLKTRKTVWYFLSFLPASLLLVTRGEGLIYFGVYMLVSAIIYFTLPRSKKDRLLQKRHILLLLLPLYVVVLLGVYLKKFNAEYLFSQIKTYQGALSSFSTLFLIIIVLLGIGILGLYLFVKSSDRYDYKKQRQRLLLYAIVIILTGVETYFIYSLIRGRLTWSFYRIQFSLEILILYFFFIFILLVFSGLFRKIYGKKQFYLTLFALPSFIFLVESNIAPDQPWFMRRFLAVFIPYIIILATYSFMKMKLIPEKKVLVFVGVLTLNIVIALPVLAFVDNKGMSNTLSSFSKEFSDDDLLLMEPGWDWQKWSYAMHFLYDVNVIPNLSVYPDHFFAEELPALTEKYPNWETDTTDLMHIKHYHDQKRIESLKPYLKDYKNIYVLTSSPFKYPFYDVLNMDFIEETKWNYKTLKPSTQILGYIKTSGSDMDLKVIRESQKNTPPRTTEEVSNSLLLLKVKDPNKLVIKENLTEQEIVEYRALLTTLLHK